MRFFVLLPVCLLTACQSVPPGASLPDYMLVLTDPPGATLTFEDGVSCETPCRVKISAPLKMKIARVGYRAKTVTLVANTSGEVLYPLEHSAPVKDVEAEELPEL